ncbi:MAG TPA: MFS transporter [Bacteroidales bacterium]|nr:MFS transporter [Bacteroidales bacterium]HRX98453.1 MFS transporter [Bacteroidales bacterium]
MKLLKGTYTEAEHHTFNLHLAYSIIEGIILGVLALNEFVLIKSLHGTNLQIGVLFQFSMLVFIFLLFINEFIKRTENKRKLLRYTGLFTRGPLFLLLFFPNDPEIFQGTLLYQAIFLVLFFIYYFGNTIIYPLINLFLKKQYGHSNFGKLYGIATSVNKIVMLGATFVYGILLDRDAQAYQYVFPVVAVLGVVSVFLLSMIRYQEEIKKRREQFFQSIRRSASTMVDILKTNKPYFHFEVGFMFYGFAFMITTTVITIFLERALHLNYSSVAFYKNAYNILAIILLPYTGKLLGKIDPRKFAVITFGSLTLFIFFMMLTEHFPMHITIAGLDLYLMLGFAYLSYGVFAATMALLWFIGSAYFCKTEEAGDYQSVHLFLTAARASVAPLFGVFFYELVGFTWTFLLAIASLLGGIGLMVWSYRRDKKVVNIN